MRLIGVRDAHVADDALDIAHEQAWKRAKILHRDISAGNILWLPYRSSNGSMRVIGILADWDLCKSKEYLERVSRPGRSVSSAMVTSSDCADCEMDRVRGHSCPWGFYAILERNTKLRMI